MFRGYPLQTMLRALPVPIALLPSAILFASSHLANPNVVRGFTFINTVLAGIWLGIAFVRTRSLWFPLSVHWSWNFATGPLLGLPVSGGTRLHPEPLLRATEVGPAWFTGGAYGIEGGAACTIALVISTMFIWRTRWITTTEEMKKYSQPESLAASPRNASSSASRG